MHLLKPNSSKVISTKQSPQMDMGKNLHPINSANSSSTTEVTLICCSVCFQIKKSFVQSSLYSRAGYDGVCTVYQFFGINLYPVGFVTLYYKSEVML